MIITAPQQRKVKPVSLALIFVPLSTDFTESKITQKVSSKSQPLVREQNQLFLLKPYKMSSHFELADRRTVTTLGERNCDSM
jgi:hypothetical protein